MQNASPRGGMEDEAGEEVEEEKEVEGEGAAGGSFCAPRAPRDRRALLCRPAERRPRMPGCRTTQEEEDEEEEEE